MNSLSLKTSSSKDSTTQSSCNPEKTQEDDEEEIKILLARINALEIENKILVTNISTLFYTAREEIERKDGIIRDLRQQISELASIKQHNTQKND